MFVWGVKDRTNREKERFSVKRSSQIVWLYQVHHRYRDWCPDQNALACFSTSFSRFTRYFVFIRPLWFEVLYNQRLNRFFCCLYDVRSAYKYVIKSMIDHHHQIHIFMTLMMMMLMRQGCFSKMRSRKVYRNTPLPWFYHRLRHLLFQLNSVIYSWLNICAFNIVLAL